MTAEAQVIRAEAPSGRVHWWQAALVAGIALAIAAVEWIFTYDSVALAIGLALGLVLATYIAISTLHLGREIAHCAESLAIIPLYILFTSSLPWFFLGQEYLLPAVYSLVLILCFWHIYQRGLSLRGIINFQAGKLPRNILLALLIGIPAGVVEYFVLTPPATFPTFEFTHLARDFAYMFLFVGFAEELLFRGLIQTDLAAAFGIRWAIFGSSAIFAVMHLTWRSSLELVFVFAVGLLLGYIYHRTRSLVLPTLVHAVGNTVLVAIMPYMFHLA